MSVGSGSHIRVMPPKPIVTCNFRIPVNVAELAESKTICVRFAVPFALVVATPPRSLKVIVVAVAGRLLNGVPVPSPTVVPSARVALRVTFLEPSDVEVSITLLPGNWIFQGKLAPRTNSTFLFCLTASALAFCSPFAADSAAV